MKQEMDDALVRDFPNLYRNRQNKQSCLWYGLTVGDGWEPLVRELSMKLEALILALPARRRKKCNAEQVKEKFGELRFYMHGGTDEMYALIREAEEKSVVTCESCGAPGSVKNNKGWLRSACATC